MFFYEVGEDGVGMVCLVFLGGGDFCFEIECIDVMLIDILFFWVMCRCFGYDLED